MEEELSFLRRKVNRLEDMIFNINDKIGLILEKFLNHRASHAAGIREVLQVEEDICLSLVTQLKSCIIGASGSSNRYKDRNSAGNTNTKKAKTQSQPRSLTRSNASVARQSSTSVAATVSSLPRVALTRLANQAKYTAGSNYINVRTTPNKRRRQTTDDDEDPLVQSDQDNDSSANLSDLFTINVKTEQTEADFQPEDGGSGLEFGQIEGNVEGQAQESEPSEPSDEEDEDSERDDPDFVGPGSTSLKSANAQTTTPKKSSNFVPSLRSFPSVDEAVAQIKAEGQFLVSKKIYTATGSKLYCKCRHDKKCAVKMHLNVDEATGVVDEYICPDPPPHVHRQKIPKRGGLAAEVKAAMEEIYLRPGGGDGEDVNLSMEKLQEELIRRGFDARDVPKHRINSYVSKLKRMRFGDLSFMKRRGPRPKPKLSTGPTGPTSTTAMLIP